MAENQILSLTGFSLHYGPFQALHDISFSIGKGEIVALVGESGSGKSTIGRAINGIAQLSRKVRVSGEINFDGRDMTMFSDKDFRNIRGRRMAMVFQDPTSALNPTFTIGKHFAMLTPNVPREAVSGLLREVLIEDPTRVISSYPFQLSGGLNQRVTIALALSGEPDLLIADEPGTALDVTVQARTLDLMQKLVRDRGTSVLLISHNLGVVRQIADKVLVLRKGRIVEGGPVKSVFSNPRHPYTQALFAAIPSISRKDPASETSLGDLEDEACYLHGDAG
ncbi:oligopeptide/dipeptide ABC transporter, ATP-binding protein, C-terminal domain-containing protein [Shimia aestuarii]|uniref:Oligopeptide/dipeptide ABC transporter, ATP-binding protein, C-terminal domain-containing protein n=1 Tax=Shimia aestuarii TaxID=254406 RepID=A0A1I4SMC6_9RHOB|nr:oligopeptide/dipeptide ABC transporter, ATP-binding protein, C-terminal domain-containing protein [Shimia aestuarii]